MTESFIKKTLESDNHQESPQENEPGTTKRQVGISDPSAAEPTVTTYKSKNLFFTLKEIEVEDVDGSNLPLNKCHSKFRCNECSCYSEYNCNDAASNEKEKPSQNNAQPFKLG